MPLTSPTLAGNRPSTPTASPSPVPHVVAGSNPVAAAIAHPMAAPTTVIAGSAPASAASITGLAATASQAIVPAATTRLAAAMTRMPAEIARVLAAMPSPCSAGLRPIAAIGSATQPGGRRLLPTGRGSLRRSSAPKSFWRRVKTCGLRSNPAARVRGRVSLLPMAGDWQNQCARVSTAASFGGALKRRRNCHHLALSTTGFLPLRRPCPPRSSPRAPVPEVVALALTRTPAALTGRSVLEEERLSQRHTVSQGRSPC